jgi:DNA-binding NarL/FixJ family response regulator
LTDSPISSRAGAVRLLVVDLDGSLGATGLARDPAFELVTVATLTAAAAVLSRQKVAALVVLFGDPSPDDIVELRELAPKLGGAPILVISRPVGETRATQMLKAGAGGYLFSDDARIAPAAVRELLNGGVPMSAPVSRLVLGRARRSSTQMAAVLPVAQAAAGTPLTPRQREILRLLSAGHSYEQIGLALDLSVNTIRSHLRTIYDRLGASTKVEAVMIGVELGLLERSNPNVKKA